MAVPSPSSIESELRLAIDAFRAGNLDSAEVRINNLLIHHSNRADVLLSKGVLLIARGDAQGGLAALDRSLSIDPTGPEALGWAAQASLNLRRFEAAAHFANRLIKVDSLNQRAYYLLANSLLGLGQFQDGLRAIDRCLELKPDDAESLATKARLLKGWRLPALAVEFYRRALAIRPLPGASIDLAQILLKESQPEDALAVLESASAVLPEAARPYDLIAQAQTELQRFDEADVNWRLAERFAANSLMVVQARAQAEIAAGRFEAAEAHLMAIMDDERGMAHGYFLLSTARKMRKDDLPLAERMQSLLAKGGLPDAQAVELNYALGKTFDDLQEYEQAIRCFDEANRIGFDLSSARSPFDLDRARAYTDAQIAYFTEARIRDTQEFGLESSLPLFVVGMPRSGTTLTSSILTAHSKVGGGAEYSFWPERAIEFVQLLDDELILNLPLVGQFANSYLDLLNDRYPNLLHAVDKNPNNFQFSALLHCFFPNSKIVHVQRHPVDNVLSIWMTRMSEDGSFASKRENLVFLYKEHLRLLRHFRKVISEDRLSTFRYEDLTSDPERTIGAMLDFVGLETERACFEPEKNLRTVLTPSVQQVRQPIHQRSQARWRNYEPWLGPFADLLESDEFA